MEKDDSKVTRRGRKYVGNIDFCTCVCDQCVQYRLYLSRIGDDFDWDYAHDFLSNHWRDLVYDLRMEELFGSKIVEQDYNQYNWMKNYKCRCLTFTVNEDVIDYNILWDIVNKLVKKKQFCVKYWAASVELTEQGKPHIHLVVFYDKANKRGIDTAWIRKEFAPRFECKKPLDGVGISYYQYLMKDIDNENVKNWCKNNNFVQHRQEFPN